MQELDLPPYCERQPPVAGETRLKLFDPIERKSVTFWEVVVQQAVMFGIT
jgi:hypothetical protein